MSKNTPVSKHTKDILLLFAVPFSIGLIAVLTLYVPRLFANPGYDFIYTYCESYDCDDEYTLKDNRVVRQAPTANSRYTYTSNHTDQKLGYYDAESDSTRILSFEEAASYKLLNSSKSPDGYSLVRESSEGGFLFWGSSNESWQLKNGLKQQPVQLNGGRDSYNEDVTLLGWVQ
jgi:hypothetical protein